MPLAFSFFSLYKHITEHSRLLFYFHTPYFCDLNCHNVQRCAGFKCILQLYCNFSMNTRRHIFFPLPGWHVSHFVLYYTGNLLTLFLSTNSYKSTGNSHVACRLMFTISIATFAALTTFVFCDKASSSQVPRVVKIKCKVITILHVVHLFQ